MVNTQRHTCKWVAHCMECVFLSCFCRGERESKFAPLLIDWLIHSINPYPLPYILSTGLSMGIYGCVICFHLWGVHQAEGGTYSHIQMNSLQGGDAEKDKFIWVRWHRWEESGSSSQGLKGPEGRFGARIYWRDDQPIQIFFLKI